MTARLLCIGECMIEMSPTGTGSYSLGFAGDTFNTAWYARRLAGSELDVAFLSAVGDDAPSEEMTAFVRQAGIVPEFKVRRGGHVGLYLVTLQDGERSFSYWRDTSAARSLADDLDTLPEMKPGDLVLFSGITMAILPDAGRDRLLHVLRQARENGVRIAFDPNLRPRLWASTDEMCTWISTAATVADIALPSYEDEATYFGDASKRGTGQRYLDAGAHLVVTKDGGESVLLRSAEEDIEVRPPEPSRIIDTTAAGDSFNAGFLVAHLSGASHETAITSACAVAAQVVAKRGALVDISAPVKNDAS